MEQSEVTPEQLFEAYREAMYTLRREGRDTHGAYIPPVTYVEVDDQRKAIFEQMADHVNRLVYATHPTRSLANPNDQEILAEVQQVKQEIAELEVKLRETLSQIRRLDARRSQLTRKLSKQAQIEHLFD